MDNIQLMTKLVDVSRQLTAMVWNFVILRDSFYDWAEKEEIYEFCKKLIRVRLLRNGLFEEFKEGYEGRFSKDLEPIYSEVLEALKNDLDEMDKELFALCEKYGTKKEEEP